MNSICGGLLRRQFFAVVSFGDVNDFHEFLTLNIRRKVGKGIQQNFFIGSQFQRFVVCFRFFGFKLQQRLNAFPGVFPDGRRFALQVFGYRVGADVGKFGKLGDGFKTFFDTFLKRFGYFSGQFHFFQILILRLIRNWCLCNGRRLPAMGESWWKNAQSTGCSFQT